MHFLAEWAYTTDISSASDVDTEDIRRKPSSGGSSSTDMLADLEAADRGWIRQEKDGAGASCFWRRVFVLIAEQRGLEAGGRNRKHLDEEALFPMFSRVIDRGGGVENGTGGWWADDVVGEVTTWRSGLCSLWPANDLPYQESCFLHPRLWPPSAELAQWHSAPGSLMSRARQPINSAGWHPGFVLHHPWYKTL